MQKYKVTYHSEMGERFIKNLDKISEDDYFCTYKNLRGTIYRINKKKIILEILTEVVE